MKGAKIIFAVLCVSFVGFLIYDSIVRRSEADDLRERASNIAEQLETLRADQREITIGLGAISERLNDDVGRAQEIAAGLGRIEAANQRIGSQLVSLTRRVGGIEAGVVESGELIGANLEILQRIQDRDSSED